MRACGACCRLVKARLRSTFVLEGGGRVSSSGRAEPLFHDLLSTFAAVILYVRSVELSGPASLAAPISFSSAGNRRRFHERGVRNGVIIAATIFGLSP